MLPHKSSLLIIEFNITAPPPSGWRPYVPETFKQSLPESDIIARISGEESRLMCAKLIKYNQKSCSRAPSPRLNCSRYKLTTLKSL